MKKITLLFLMFGLTIGTINLNAQVILNQTFDATYAADISGGKTAWGSNSILSGTDYAHGFGNILPPSGWSGSAASSCMWLQGFLTLGSPGNQNTQADEDAWFTCTLTGLTVGHQYKVEVPVVRSQGRSGVAHMLHAWSTSPPSLTTGYVSANSLYTTTTGAAEAEQLLMDSFVADATTMTFGVGIGRAGTTDMFNKTRILSMKITDNGVLSLEHNNFLKNSFSVSKTGVTLNDVSGNVQIIDLLGRTLVSEQVENHGTLDYNFKEAIIYMVKLSTDVGSATKKVILN